MYLLKKVKENVIGIADVIKSQGLRKAIRVFIFNVIFNIVPPPSKEEVIKSEIGLKISILPHDRGISRELKIFKVHEPLTTKTLIKELIRLKKLLRKVTVVDIGSNIGYYAILEAKILGENGTVICIEPVRRNFQALLKNIELNNVDNAEAIKVALSDKRGLAKMIVASGSNWARLLDDKDYSAPQTENVRVTTLDNIFSNNRKIDLIRMDVEGHEYRVIKGGLHIIKKHLPSFLIEVHPNLLGKHELQNLLSIFRDLGYTIKILIYRNTDVPLAAFDKDIVTNIDFSSLIMHSPNWPFTLFIEHPNKIRHGQPNENRHSW